MANDVDRVSSSDHDYTVGDLSSFPSDLDTMESLFTAVDSGTTRLSGPMSFQSDFAPVRNTDGFPSSGLIVIDKEVIYYDRKGDKFFADLIRGFAGKRSPHDMEEEVKAAVCSDHHNSVRDAILSAQQKMGLSSDSSEEATIYGRLKALEGQYLPLRAVFSTITTDGQPGEVFTFKDRSLGGPVSWLWEFGDGTTSTSRNPTHLYSATEDGSSQSFTVSLTITDIIGTTSVCRKKDYIRIGSPKVVLYTEQTTYHLQSGRASVLFYDQSVGTVIERRWSFGDGGEYISEEPAETTITHVYRRVGTYSVSLVIDTPAGVAAGPEGGFQIRILE